MKKARKLTALMLLAAFVFAFIVPVTAMAANDGTITINNTVADKKYSIYRIFDLESYSDNTPDNHADGAYSYKVSDKWSAFFTEGAAGRNYVDINNGYVTWKADANVADFAAAAIQFAKDNGISNDGDTTATAANNDENPVKFENLPLGYYLVQSDLGALCALTTTNKDATVIEKNVEPSLDKQVQEGNTWGTTNDANIGDKVNFQATITVQGEAIKYVMHDTMDDGLSFGTVNDEVLGEVTGVKLNGETVAPEGNYEVKTTALGDDCTFHVVFTDKFCASLKSNDKIVVSYNATLNSNAVVGTPENNNAHLSYKDKNNTDKETEDKTTKTYNWELDVLKYGNNIESNVLSGAQFVLLDSTKEKVATIENGKIASWGAKPTADQDGTIAWVASSVLTTGTDGKIAITGLDEGTYYLEEIKAPDGYNKLAEPITVVITSTPGETPDTLTGTVSYTLGTVNGTGEVKVNNNSGVELPSTGGIGTTIFYAVGAALVLGAGVLLVTKKRMTGQR